MSGLHHVSCVDVVVISYIGVVVVLQRHHEGDESVSWDFKGFQKVSLLTS